MRPPPSLRLWAIARANPAALGSFALLDEVPELLLDFEEYAAAEARANERRRAAARLAQRRESGPSAGRARVAGRRR